MTKANLKIAFQVVLFALLGVLILYFLWQSLGQSYADECATKGIPESDCSLFDKLTSDYANAKFSWLFVISICLIISQVFRAIRWRILFRSMGYNVSHFNALACTLVGYFANLGFPRIGEFVRAGLISKYSNVAVEKAIATIVIERVVDLIMFGILILLGLVFHYENLLGYVTKNTNISGTVVLITIGVLAAGGILGIFLLKKILAYDDNRLHPALRKIKNLIESFLHGLNDIRKLPEVGAFWAHSFGIWLMYFLMHYFAFFSFKPTEHLTVIDAILVFDFGTMGIIFPSPGGMGSYHFMIMEGLKIFGVNQVDGFSFAMITFFTLTIFCTILLGLISLILLPIINHTKKIV